MQGQDAAVCAAIDIGSNTLRVVIARCLSTGLDILATDEALVRIGESVNATGEISDEKQDHTIAVLRQFQQLGQQHSAQVTLAIATEAIRKATNRAAFLAAIKDATGIDIHCIDGAIESVLTFYGATYALNEQARTPALVGVMDLGGGSTELVLAKHQQIIWHTSLPIGSGWLHDRYLTADPPTHSDNEAASTFLRTYLYGLELNRFPSILYATGGSANTLLHMAQQAFGLNTTDDTLTYMDLIRCEGLLWSLPAQEIAQRYQIDTRRARILSAGVLILRSIMKRFELSEIHVSTNGIREGLALAYARYGEQWFEQTLQAAQGSTPERMTHKQRVASAANTYEEPFVDAGLRMLRERATVMFSWRNAVLQNTDIEAVHKMRVGSRRLRAVMDAYEGIADPKIFKPVYKLVKKTADVLGAARDTDVMIKNLQDQLEQLPSLEQAGIRWLLNRLEAYRKDHQQALIAHINSLDEADVMRQLEHCLRKEH